MTPVWWEVCTFRFLYLLEEDYEEEPNGIIGEELLECPQEVSW